MRLKSLLIAAAMLFGLSAAATDPAAADGFHRHGKPHGYGKVRTIKHYVYRPVYRHVYYVDPYAYRYSPRGYYPYYGSHYWQPAAYVRKRNRLHYNCWNTCPPRYRYYASWGYPKKRWHHRKWHRKHHGKHYKHHW